MLLVVIVLAFTIGPIWLFFHWFGPKDSDVEPQPQVATEVDAGVEKRQ